MVPAVVEANKESGIYERLSKVNDLWAQLFSLTEYVSETPANISEHQQFQIILILTVVNYGGGAINCLD